MNSKIKDKYTALHNTRFLWLKNPGDLSGKQQARLEELSQLEFLDTVKAYWLRLRVQEFYESYKAYDWSLLIDYEALALEVCNSEIVEKKKFGELFTRNGEDILNYFLTFRTNAILEGFNSKISIIKNRARGFKNLKNFINMIYFICGELSFPISSIMWLLPTVNSEWPNIVKKKIDSVVVLKHY